MRYCVHGSAGEAKRVRAARKVYVSARLIPPPPAVRRKHRHNQRETAAVVRGLNRRASAESMTPLRVVEL